MTDPQDAIPDPVQSSDYWTGYYEGKRVAGNEATQWIIAQDRRLLRPKLPAYWLLILSDAVALVSGFYVMLPYQLGDASNLAHFAVGILYGIYVGNTAWAWRHR